MCGMMNIVAPLMKKALAQKKNMLGQTLAGKAVKAITKKPTATAVAKPKAPTPTTPATQPTGPIPDMPMWKKRKAVGAGGGYISRRNNGDRSRFRNRQSLSLQPTASLGAGSSNNGLNVNNIL